RRPPKGLLSEWLWTVLVELWQAGADGIPAERRWTAWSYLEDRKTGALIERVRITQAAAQRHRLGYARGSGWAPSDAGRAPYELHWATYARLHPGVTAPDPTGRMDWPAAVDQHLRALGHVVDELRRHLDQVIAQRHQLQATTPGPGPASPADQPSP